MHGSHGGRDERDEVAFDHAITEKGLKKVEHTFLEALKDDDLMKRIAVGHLEDDLPKVIKDVLEENKGIMPPELPKKLPHRREVDHKIELEPGAKPLTMTPYWMAPLELEEL